jgi:hypothetical protein
MINSRIYGLIKVSFVKIIKIIGEKFRETP